MKGILSLSWGDITKAIVLAVVVFGLAYLNQVYNILGSISPEIQASLIAGASYLLKNFFTTNSGKIGGVIPTE